MEKFHDFKLKSRRYWNIISSRFSCKLLRKRKLINLRARSKKIRPIELNYHASYIIFLGDKKPAASISKNIKKIYIQRII